ncbi:hypothetical protein FH972_006314 [Carpinus fangiana]|uniref:AMP-binding enzyme C-terminal domain-containing protein n=1 Tax=Carpinus fangiana TaxID=176857 RepID=A0A5N6QTR6_9ROSI|nr:hypothetical protein FH972_006314 [Carpinus fangiana]
MKRKRFAQGIFGGVWPDAYFESIPPGWRFRPTKRHLLQYLKAKILNKPLPGNRIPEVDLYAHHPQDLVADMMREPPLHQSYTFTNQVLRMPYSDVGMVEEAEPQYNGGMQIADMMREPPLQQSYTFTNQVLRMPYSDVGMVEEEKPQYSGGLQIADMMREPPLQQSYTFTNQVLRMPYSDVGMVEEEEPQYNGGVQIADMKREPPLQQSSTFTNQALRMPYSDVGMGYMSSMNENLQPPLMQSSSFGMPPLLQAPLITQSSSFGMPPLLQASQNGTLEDVVFEFGVKEKKDDDVAVQLPEDGGKVADEKDDVAVQLPEDCCTVAEDEDVVTVLRPDKGANSVEVESALYKHPRVLEAAVVAMPHPHWGESPCAFVALTKNSAGKTSDDVREAEIISHCRKNLPHFMVPKKVEFLPELPKNSTGKILKNELRAKAKELVISTKSSHDVNRQRTNPPYGEQNLQGFSRL